LTALTDLGAGTYQSYTGGLYPNGLNQPPAAYLTQGMARAQAVVPRDTGGQPNSSGKIGLLSIGISNALLEFAQFKTISDPDPIKNSKVVIVNGAEFGKDAELISKSTDPYWSSWVPQQLSASLVVTYQVQVVWLKEAIIMPSQFGAFPAHAQRLQSDLQAIVQILTNAFPNLQIIYVASRTYAGYATINLNPEPYAYESGFSVQWLIADRIQNNPAARPWIAWGPYLWTNGVSGRSDGLVWNCADTYSDGTHPSPSGTQKVAGLLLSFFKSDPSAQPWFGGYRVSLPLMSNEP
jgi:hypothetical protein